MEVLKVCNSLAEVWYLQAPTPNRKLEAKLQNGIMRITECHQFVGSVGSVGGVAGVPQITLGIEILLGIPDPATNLLMENIGNTEKVMAGKRLKREMMGNNQLLKLKLKNDQHF